MELSKTKTNLYHIKTILLGIVAFVMVTMSMFHIFFNWHSEKQIAHKKTYKPIVTKSDNEMLNSIDNHVNTLITKYPNDKTLNNLALTLKANYTKNHNNFINKVKAYNQKNKELAQEHSFLGRNSLQFWIFIFGLVTALLFFACKSLYTDIAKGSNYKFQFVSITGIVIAFFWMIHLFFFTQKDFNQKNYIVVILLSAGFCTMFTYFLVKNFTYKDKTIYKLLNFIYHLKTFDLKKLGVKAMFAESEGVPYNAKEPAEDDVKNINLKIKETLSNL